MKRVALLGDSIRLIGYGTKVPEMLEGEFEVYQPKENCTFSPNMLRMVSQLKDTLDSCDVIHFNSGEWDVTPLVDDVPHIPIDMYLKIMCRIADILLTYSKNVVFATTTPVTDKHPNRNEDIYEYNEKLVPLLREKGVYINDLCSLVNENVDEYICDDGIHLSDKGIEVCANQVCDIIRKVSEE